MKPFYDHGGVTIHQGDALSTLKSLPDESVNCCVTSPPYWGLRDYGNDSQLGLEDTPEEYVSKMTTVFEEVKRILTDDGTLWLNLGDSYYGSRGNYGGGNRGEGKQRLVKQGSLPNPAWEGREEYKPAATKKHPSVKPKDLVGIPWRVAFSLQADGWYLRQDIIWHKPNPMPESVTDRCTKAHEYLFLLSKSQKYHYDNEAIQEPAERAGCTPGGTKYSKPDASGTIMGRHTEASLHRAPVGTTRNKRSVWTVPTKSYPEAHFATFPPDLITPCILAGCPEGGVVLDPFIGSGTTAQVAKYNGRKCVGIELNPEYCELIPNRVEQGVLF